MVDSLDVEPNRSRYPPGDLGRIRRRDSRRGVGRRRRPISVAVAIRIAATLTMMGCSEPETCDEVLEEMREIAADMHEHDWEPFRSIVVVPSLVSDPETDLAFCEELVDDLGVIEVEGKAGVSLYTVLVLPDDFEDWSTEAWAAMYCHESVHLVWEHRVGLVEALWTWGSDAGRLAVEGTAIAMSAGMIGRYGLGKGAVTRYLNKFAKDFADGYGTDVDAECAGRAFEWAVERHREWAVGGVERLEK